jgi:hypothetical protein
MVLRPYQDEAADFLYSRDRAMILAPEWKAIFDVWEYKNEGLYWKIKCGRGNSVKYPNDKVNVAADPLGYFYVTWKRKHYAVHRVIFLLTQKWLPECIDHIDGNPSNNNISNLRPATRLQNQYNRRINLKCKSGIKNVTPHQGKWLVRFSVNSKTKHYGVFENLEFAELVAQEIRLKLHKEFARHV